MMMKRFLAVAVLILAAACSDDSTGPEVSTASIVIKNRMSSPIAFVYIADCAVNTWGNDRLGANEVIGTTQDRAFSVEPGCWDVRVETLDNRFAEQAAIEVDAGQRFEFTVTN